ncbi:hypothetical protein B5C34_00480 [Pacificimonas flava]|uniref:5-bromo-4-chloroindolyl phosphate hydrolysis protein n=2 Tax=Pacificimonas TaxID=1960290 RepID=A0A219B163_9SPHN|nr:MULTISPECIES: hypothetical protein [Pacificimonas]MBZ6378312.1 hypothetical protein [Pacificimonas aurantium]OWV32077.1 hypothetical protein B5C34_00480 [Pacificimonas flava]
MSRDVDRVLGKFDEFVDRSERRYRDLANSDAGRAALRRRESRMGSGLRTRVIRGAGALVAVMVALFVAGLVFGPIGIDGLLWAILGLGAAVLVASFSPVRKEPEPTVETIRNAELAALPVRVERWLEKRRSDLPAAAARQVDELVLRLEVLAEQLEKVGADAPVVKDARKLIGEELPRLVESYLDVHQSYRSPGSEAEQQLTEGLETVSAELQRLSEQLARGDLDRLAIEGRFLESKYRDGGAG